MSDFAAEEDRSASLEYRLNDAEEVLVARYAAYERINKRAYDEEDEANPESPPRGEEQVRVSQALDLLNGAQRPFKAPTPPSEDALDDVEQTLTVIESIINDTPADETAPRVLDDEDDGYDWDDEDAIACDEQ